ncbi:MAG TPA: hypothetical protein VGJ00_01090 [Rhabdochlamydiaceae bacterium]
MSGNTTGGFTLATNGTVPFENLVSTPNDTRLSLVGGNIVIADTGVYQIEIGVMPITATATALSFAVGINGGVNVMQRNIDAETAAQPPIFMFCQSMIISIVVNPTTLTLVNRGSSININTFRGNAGMTNRGICAFMTIIKLGSL